MKKAIQNDGFNYFKQDADFEHSALVGGITSRSQDMFGVGGFISGGVVTVNISDPDKVDISAGVFYDSRGEKILLTAQVGITIPDLVGGNNWILVSYQNFDDTQMADPLYGTLQNTRTQEQFNIDVKATFTQGDLDGLGNPYVPVALVTKPGSVLNIVDSRNMLLNLKPNSVDTPQLVDRSITFGKLAAYARSLIWNPDEPNLYYDVEDGKLKVQGVGHFNFPGSSLTNTLLASVFPLTIAAVPTIIAATETTSGNWTAFDCGFGFDPSNLNKNQILLGYINEENIFVNIQASTRDENIHMSEDETQGQRRPMHRNMWRRFNEQFQSFTPSTDDGVAVVDPNKLVIVGSDFQVKAGSSYVAGRRVLFTSDTILGPANTGTSWSLAVSGGQVKVYVLRDMVAGQRFILETISVPINGYLLGTVYYNPGAVADHIVSDDRVFSPVKEVSFVPEIASDVLNGSKFLWKGFQEIIVGPGMVGFPDGTLRKNTIDKTIDFTDVSTDIVTTEQLTGRLDTGSLAPFKWYGIFATADNPGTGFNLLASQIPFVTGVTGTPNNYNVSSTAGFFVGQRVRVTVNDKSAINSVWSGAGVENNFSGVDTSGEAGEVITNIVPNTSITTTGIAPSNPIVSGTITPLDKIRPTLTGITKYRLLGIVGSDDISRIKKFVHDGDKFLTDNTGGLCMFISAGWGQNYTGVKDLQRYSPSLARTVVVNGVLSIRAEGPSNNDSDHSAWIKMADRAARAIGVPGSDGVYLMALVQSLEFDTTFGTHIERKGKAQAGTAEFGTFQNTIAFETVTQLSTLWWAYLSVMGYTIDIKREWGLQTPGGFA